MEPTPREEIVEKYVNAWKPWWEASKPFGISEEVAREQFEKMVMDYESALQRAYDQLIYEAIEEHKREETQ